MLDSFTASIIGMFLYYCILVFLSGIFYRLVHKKNPTFKHAAKSVALYFFTHLFFWASLAIIILRPDISLIVLFFVSVVLVFFVVLAVYKDLNMAITLNNKRIHNFEIGLIAVIILLMPFIIMWAFSKTDIFYLVFIIALFFVAGLSIYRCYKENGLIIRTIVDVILLVAGIIPYLLFFYDPLYINKKIIIAYAAISLVLALVLLGKLIAVIVISIITKEIKSTLQLGTYIFRIYFPLLIIYCCIVLFHYAASASV